MCWRHFIAITGLLAGTAAQAAQVGLIKIDGAIGPATASYISRAIDAAAAQNDECLVIQLDTPGGLLQSTKEIVQKLYSSKVPTIVYVSRAAPAFLSPWRPMSQ
jgi:membrane-bound serine protease (ClpP class)